MNTFQIKRPEFIKILKNRGVKIRDSASTGEIYKQIGNLTKKDLVYLAKHRNIQLNDDETIETIYDLLAKHVHKKTLTTLNQQLLKDKVVEQTPSYVKEFNRQQIINKANRKKLSGEIYRNIQKRKQHKIN